jgi:5-methylcytosine-specific restriction endonuclease McrBC GTP-binding regulatory subunit McrB
MKFLNRAQAFFQKFIEVLKLHTENQDLRQKLALVQHSYERLHYDHEILERTFSELQGAYKVVRREALQAEQIITGVQHHLRDFPNDTSRAVKHMLAAR